MIDNKNVKKSARKVQKEIAKGATPCESVAIPKALYDRLCYLGIIDESGVRDYNVGKSDYAHHLIQPWAIWQDYDMNAWDADITKRVLRTKEEEGMTMAESRMMDYTKIIHDCEERIRQLKYE